MANFMPGEWNLLVKNGTANITIDKSRLSYLVQSMNNLTASIIFISKKHYKIYSLIFIVSKKGR